MSNVLYAQTIEFWLKSYAKSVVWPFHYVLSQLATLILKAKHTVQKKCLKIYIILDMYVYDAYNTAMHDHWIANFAHLLLHVFFKSPLLTSKELLSVWVGFLFSHEMNCFQIFNCISKRIYTDVCMYTCKMYVHIILS